ncbi:MAG: metalloregulator ArsR/SmtB family transcription factor [Imperialibacter sp.]|uniref:ArsR/SmtB family transcription factor n=1 Tax=Imperialibacter sp. TaxID=2038411 RepID=UPI0032EE3424
MQRDVFAAIADPTRREIITMLASQPLNLNTVADKFDISRPAVAKHLKLLKECGLIDIEKRGRESFCSARLDGLKEVTDWTAKMRAFWTQKLDALEVFLENDQNTKQDKNHE